MSLFSTLNKIVFTGDSTTKEFDVPFYVLAEADLKLSLVDIATNVETNITTNYSIAPTGGSFPALTSTVTYPVSGDAVTSSYKIVIMREIDVLQPTVYPTNGDFTPKVIEQSFDRITMIAQQQQEELDRALKVGVVSDESLEELMDTLTASVSAAAESASSAAASESNAGTSETNAVNAAASAAESLAAINTSIDDRLATQAQAEAGIDNENLATSLRVAQAITALGFKPKSATGVGQFTTLVWDLTTNHTVSLPAGGTWAYFFFYHYCFNGGDSSGERGSNSGAGINTGGTVLATNNYIKALSGGAGLEGYGGFALRIE